MNLGVGEDGISAQPRNLRSEAHVSLKVANMAYTECVTKSFLPKWLKGESLQINEVCGAQYEDMMEKHAGIYGELPMPLSTLTLPTAPMQ